MPVVDDAAPSTPPMMETLDLGHTYALGRVLHLIGKSVHRELEAWQAMQFRDRCCRSMLLFARVAFDEHRRYDDQLRERVGDANCAFERRVTSNGVARTQTRISTRLSKLAPSNSGVGPMTRELRLE